MNKIVDEVKSVVTKVVDGVEHVVEEVVEKVESVFHHDTVSGGTDSVPPANT
jgi:hypothetical protein